MSVSINPDFLLIHTRWEDSKTALGEVRRAVFVEEQQVPETLEWVHKTQSEGVEEYSQD